MQCADMYLTFEVNTSKVKSSRRIEMNYENKKARAVGMAESIMNQCVILYNNLQSVVKVDKMCRLCDNFLFILGMLNSLGSQCDVMPSTLYCARFAYYPLLVDMRKDIDIVSSQLYVCHILVSKKCQLQAGTIHPRPLA